MKIHKAIPESMHLVLSALMESGDKDAPTLACPGTYHGRPCVVVAVHGERDGHDALMPLAVVLDPDSDDAAYLTISGTTSSGPGAPSPTGEAQETAALAVLRDVADSGGLVSKVLAERAQRVLAGRPAAPAAPVSHTGLYL